ncbi:aurora kinase A and ninein-interacting protein [Rhinatrema bivittatum]|uniref:aurora kinase A and ninein-interacting protein n=1 Tax=Rhinatrema bivittatum TaxID=194408 RepID=UPI0011264134|nr:aurora kinase A and ninein-interacting protein [Rhinatrema bivittatum]
MARKRGRASQEKAEACGVWLDTARLKKRSTQTLLTGSISNLPNPILRRNLSVPAAFEFTQTKGLQSCIKQTSISSFFMLKPSGKENGIQQAHLMQSSPAVSWKCNKRKPDLNWKEPCNKKSSAESFQGVAEGDNLYFNSEAPNTQQCNYNQITHSVQQCDYNLAPESKKIQMHDKLIQESQKLTDQNIFLENHCEVLPNVAEYQSSAMLEPCRMESAGAYGSQLDLTQDSESNQVIAHRSKHDSVNVSEFMSNRKITTVGINSSSPKKQQGRLSAKHCRSYTESSIPGPIIPSKLHCKAPLKDGWAWETMNLAEREKDSPTGEQRSTWTIESLKCQHEGTTLAWGRKSPAKARSELQSLRHGEKQFLSTGQLFTQDSQGHKVISHHYLHRNVGKGEPELPLSDKTNLMLGDKSRVEGSTFRALSSACSYGIFSYTTQEPLANPRTLHLPSQSLLFTQDSEGNAVIKHF